MAKFKKTVVTNVGIEIMEAALAQSKPIFFTSVKCGSGIHAESENLKLATALKEEKQSFLVAEATMTETRQIKVRSDITNKDLQIGYDINEIGIYAKVEGEQERLFGITSAIFADYLPDEATAPATIITEFYIQVENAENISFTYEFPQDVYATREELELKLDKKDAFSKSYNDLKDKPTAIKNPQAISINGKTYDGSVAVNTGIQAIAYGGTGATTAIAARTALGLGTAAVKGVANNLTTTEDGFLLDAKQGKVINESLTEINQSLNWNLIATVANFEEKVIDFTKYNELNIVVKYNASENPFTNNVALITKSLTNNWRYWYCSGGFAPTIYGIYVQFRLSKSYIKLHGLVADNQPVTSGILTEIYAR